MTTKVFAMNHSLVIPLNEDKNQMAISDILKISLISIHK